MDPRKARIPTLLFVAAILLAARLNLLPVAGLNEPGTVALAILLAAAALWVTEAVPLFATSLFVLLLCLVWLAPVMRGDGIAVEDGSPSLKRFGRKRSAATKRRSPSSKPRTRNCRER